MNKELKKIIEELKADGIDNVHVEFNGGGDEGSIDSIDYHPEKPRIGFNQDVFEELLYDYLNDKGDWYHNEGGGGKVDIDVVEGTISCDMYFNEVHQDWHHYDG